jgi:hypothetical protein
MQQDFEKVVTSYAADDRRTAKLVRLRPKIIKNTTWGLCFTGYTPSCRSSDSRKELHRLSIAFTLEAEVRSRKVVDDTGHTDPEAIANANERSEQSLRPTREGRNLW